MFCRRSMKNSFFNQVSLIKLGDKCKITKQRGARKMRQRTEKKNKISHRKRWYFELGIQFCRVNGENNPYIHISVDRKCRVIYISVSQP